MAGLKISRGLGIQNRLTLLLILILLPLFVLQGYRYYDHYQDRQGAALQENLEIARAIAKSFESFVQDILRQELAIGLAITSSTKMTPGDITRLLETSSNYPAVRDFTWLNPEGIAIYSNNPALIGADFSDRSYVRDIVGGRDWAVGELVTGKLFGKPIFGISRGIRDNKGNLLGVIFAAILPDKLDAQLAIERSEGGAISLVDRQGMLVYRYPAIETTWEERNWLSQYPEYEEVLKGKEISKTFYATYEGKDRLASIVPISSIGWAAGAGKRKEDVTSPIIQSLVRDAVLFLAVSLIAFLIAAALSRKITNPIGALRTYASSLGEGKVPKKVDVENVPELQDLAESFDTMVEKVRSRETALRQALAKAEEGDRMLAALMGNVPEGITVCDAEGNIRMVSRHGQDLLGGQHADKSIKEVVKEWTVYRPDGQTVMPMEEIPLVRTLKGESVRNFELVQVNTDGRKLALLCNATPIRDRAGQILGAVVAWSDITERKRAEVTLREKEATLRGILNATQESVWLFSPEGMVLTANDVALLRLGKHADDVIGKSFVEILPTELAVSRLRHLQEVVKTGQPIEFEDERSGILFRHSFYPVTDAGGRVTGVVSFSRDVTERKQAEQALQDSEARLRFALETIHAGAWDLDLVDHTAFRSLEHDRIFGYPELLPQWTYEMFLEHVLPEDRDEVDAKFGHAIETQGDWSFECRIRRKDDEIRWILAAGHHRADAEGARRMTGIVQDITDRKRTEEALREAKDELEERVKERTHELYKESLYSRSLIEASLDPFVTISPKGKITDVNHATEEATGFSRAQLIGSDFSDYFTEPDKARAGYEAVFTRGQVRDYPLELKHRDGHVTPVFYNASLYRDEAGEIWGVFAAARDITERKRAEKALRLAGVYNRSLIESSVDPLVTIDPEGKISDVNAATEAVTGHSRKELIGTDFSNYFTEPDKARAGYEEVFRQGIVRDYPLELKHRDGKITPVHYNASVYRDETGQTLGVFAAARDITERRQAEAALRRLASELVMAEERERKRVAGILHDEIAQTLAAVKMRIDVLKGTPYEQEPILRDAKGLLVQSIRETRALMNDLGNPLLFEMGLKAACESLAERLMENHPIRIICDIQDAFKDADPDVKTILYQLIRELLTNIVKHSQAATASVLVNMENGRFHVKVTDDGVGFDPKMLGAPTIEGGFGLYSIRERLAAVHGSLQIESDPGTGTMVTAMLPASLDSSPSAGNRQGITA